MRELKLDLGVEEYELCGRVTVAFNPTDLGFLEKLTAAYERMEALQERVNRAREELTEEKDIFPLAKEIDAEMRAVIDGLFGKEVCAPLFGDMNLYASSGGFPVWANLLLAVTEECEGAMRRELQKRDERIAKYTEKYGK